LKWQKLPDGKTAMTLSLRLLRQGKTVEEAVRTDHGLEEVEADGARLFVEPSPAVPPTWFSFVRQFSVTPLARCSE
jgi:hypothetical protein